MNTTTTTTTGATASAPGRHRVRTTALRWLPTFLGFPAGGYIAEVVGRVDNPVAAIAGGAITGAVLGMVQWLGLRRNGLPPVRWIIASAVGFAIGLGVGAPAVGYATDLAALATQGAVCGIGIGMMQAAVLHRFVGHRALAWPAALGALWALGWTTTWAIGVDVDAQYTVFGSSGALVVTAATAILPIELARRSHDRRR